MLKRLRVKNFKSLENFEVEFGKFNVLVGRNNSGKSNIIDVLSFLREGFYDSKEKVFNSRGSFKDVVFGKNDENDIEIEIEGGEDDFSFRYYVKISGRYNNLKIIGEKLHINDGRTEHEFNYPEVKFFGEESLKSFSLETIASLLRSITYKDYEEFIKEPENMKKVEILGRFLSVIENIQTYAIIPYNIKPETPYAYLEKDLKLDKECKNLSLVLLNILQKDSKKFKRIRELLCGAIDEIEDIHPIIEGNRVYLKVKEAKFNNVFFSWEAADGTIALLTYITAIQLAKENITLCFEEPEDYIHARLLEFLVDLMTAYKCFLGIKKDVIV